MQLVWNQLVRVGRAEPGQWIKAQPSTSRCTMLASGSRSVHAFLRVILLKTAFPVSFLSIESKMKDFCLYESRHLEHFGSFLL